MISFKKKQDIRGSLPHYLLIGALSLTILPGGLLNSHADQPDHLANGINPSIVADYLHAVIEADRALYALHVVERMHDTGTVMASESWEHRNAIPLPAQMLLLSGLRVSEKDLGLRYRLSSLWPIYEKNGPKSDFEIEGLKAVALDPSKPFSGTIQKNGKPYFKAIYADLAVSRACVTCHNTHILSSKRDYKLGEVMGGIIISFPL